MSGDANMLTHLYLSGKNMTHTEALDFQSLRMVFYALCGAIIWDWSTTLRYELQIIRGKVPWSWPVAVYLAARYSSLLFVGGVLPQAGVRFQVNCGAVWISVLLGITFQKAFGQALFILRACAIWDWNHNIVIGLLLVWIGHAAVALSNIGLVTLSWTPDPAISGFGYCTTEFWAWSVGAGFVCSLITDAIIIVISAYRLAQMRHAARCGFWIVLLNDGISWSLFTLPPTIGAVFTFYMGQTVPAQCIAISISSTMHAVIACRAYRNLSDFADTLPLSFCARDQVRNGTMLDQETLARLAWFTGASAAEEEQGLQNSSNNNNNNQNNDRARKVTTPDVMLYSPGHHFSTSHLSLSPEKQNEITLKRQSSLPTTSDRPPAYRSGVLASPSSSTSDRQQRMRDLQRRQYPTSPGLASSFLSRHPSDRDQPTPPLPALPTLPADPLSARSTHAEASRSRSVRSSSIRPLSTSSTHPREIFNIQITTQTDRRASGDEEDEESIGSALNSASPSDPLRDPERSDSSSPTRPARAEGRKKSTHYPIVRPANPWTPSTSSSSEIQNSHSPVIKLAEEPRKRSSPYGSRSGGSTSTSASASGSGGGGGASGRCLVHDKSASHSDPALPTTTPPSASMGSATSADASPLFLPPGITGHYIFGRELATVPWQEEAVDDGGLGNEAARRDQDEDEREGREGNKDKGRRPKTARGGRK